MLHYIYCFTCETFLTITLWEWNKFLYSTCHWYNEGVHPHLSCHQSVLALSFRQTLARKREGGGRKRVNIFQCWTLHALSLSSSRALISLVLSHTWEKVRERKRRQVESKLNTRSPCFPNIYPLFSISLAPPHAFCWRCCRCQDAEVRLAVGCFLWFYFLAKPDFRSDMV